MKHNGPWIEQLSKQFEKPIPKSGDSEGWDEYINEFMEYMESLSKKDKRLLEENSGNGILGY